MTVTKINKVIRIGTPKTDGGRPFSTYCKITFSDKRLSISGVEGPLPSGDCIGSCGQILWPHSVVDEGNISLAPGWTHAMLNKFERIWGAHHLNDMHAGTPRQEAFLKENLIFGNFDDKRKALQDAGLWFDKKHLPADPERDFTQVV